jgi:predicted acylesterase/phospholipase RssA
MKSDLPKFVFLLLAAALGLVGCASTSRLPPLPLSAAKATHPLGIAEVRFYPDMDSKRLEVLAAKSVERELRALRTRGGDGKLPPANFLAISGGGDDGAFGAGLLCGWTARGDRPQFKLVTGISTGALSAPFAFLGSDYDRYLKQVYTATEAPDIFEARGALIAAVAADALTDTAPLRNLVSKFVTSEMVARIAQEYAKGRLLMIMTTNLDQGRAVIWNIGAIAESRHPKARDLIIDILMASAAIPAVFPPVMLKVSHGGVDFHEMHVDGGAIAQTFLYPPTLNLKRASRNSKVDRKRTAFIINNVRPFRPEAVVQRQTLSIAQQSTSTMFAASGLNDAYRIYLTAKRDNVEYNLAFIDSEFTVPYKGPFSQDYMRKLFEYGYKKGRGGAVWQKTPPGYKE